MTDSKQLSIETPTWVHAYGKPNSTGKIKTFPNDFMVDEQLSFQPEGAGEHVFLHIEKCGENTDYVARLLARFSGVRQRDVSYAGLKDRHAKTTQWFSVWMPGKEDLDWKPVETEQIKILQATRHARKLKRGVLTGNNFQILIRQWQGDKDKIEQQLLKIKQQGIPNYFGVQRFGHQGQNVNKALALFEGMKVKREQRSIYLSAARSYLFNQLLASRVNAGSWNKAVSGDCLIFDQSNSYFKTEQLDSSIIQRIQLGEIHPTGMMFGKGNSEVSERALELEDTIITENKTIADGLIKNGLIADRRSLRVFVNNFNWTFENNIGLHLKFFLPSGSYATSLLRELVDTEHSVSRH